MSLHKHFRICISVVLVTAMFLMGHFIGDEEMIFPEIAAVALGAWIMDKQPWHTSRIKLFGLLSASSIIGYCMSSLVMPVYIKILLCLIICFGMLLASGCSFFPLISASVLPVYMNVKSILYPVSVIALAAIIVFVQWLLEKHSVRSRSPDRYPKPDTAKRAGIFGVIFIVIALMSALTCFSGFMLVLAPPLIVAFCELMQKNSPARKTPVKTFFVISICAWLGAYGRLLLCFRLHLDYYIAAVIISVIVYYLMVLFEIYFPPACALALLPLIIDSRSLVFYPIEIMLGGGILIILSILLNRIHKVKEKSPQQLSAVEKVNIE